MHNAHEMDELGSILLELAGIINRPDRDDLLLAEAGVSLDRALFPHLVRLSVRGPTAVAELAADAGRDHTTVSRQLAKLETLGLIWRPQAQGDARTRPAALTPQGEAIAEAIKSARRRLLSKALVDWSAADRRTLVRLNRRFVDSLLAGFQAG